MPESAAAITMEVPSAAGSSQKPVKERKPSRLAKMMMVR
jgi:hypothetical protein